MTPYYIPTGGLPPQTAIHTGRAVFTEAYAVIPKGVFSDIVTSCLPGWSKTRLWLIARPMTGFSETFSQYVMEVAPGGGSDAPENDAGAQSVIFVTDGVINDAGVEYRIELETRTDTLCEFAWRNFGEENTLALLNILEPVGERFVQHINEIAGENWMPAARPRRR